MKIIIWILTGIRFYAWVATIFQQIVGQQNSHTQIKIARQLTKLLAMDKKNLGIDVIVDHVIGILNGFADAVSRGVPSVTLDTPLKKDFSTNAAAFACLQVSLSVKQVALMCFQPSQDLLAHIECILLDRSTDNLPELCKIK